MKAWIIILFLFSPAYAYCQSPAVRYIELYKEQAIRIMKENGIPASIVLGVAIHESGSGTSKIARILNNHFGFKGPNHSKEIQSAYKGYDSVAASYADFARLLKERGKFKPLFDSYSSFDYGGWAKGIQRAGYAQSPTWASQVIAIIRKYELYKYDNRPANYVGQNVTVAEASPLIYRVKAGDSLWSIARKYNTTVKALQSANQLKNSHLSIGQNLKILNRE